MTSKQSSELVERLRARARESDLGAGFVEDDDDLAEEMREDVALFRAVADALETACRERDLALDLLEPDQRELVREWATETSNQDSESK